GKRWQIETLLLPHPSLGKRNGAGRARRIERRRACANRRVARATRLRTTPDRRTIASDLLLDGMPSVIDGAGERPDLFELLLREGEPVAKLGVEFRLALAVQRNVQQRTGGSDEQPVRRNVSEDDVECIERPLQIVQPYIATVDHTGGEHLVTGKTVTPEHPE